MEKLKSKKTEKNKEYSCHSISIITFNKYWCTFTFCKNQFSSMRFMECHKNVFHGTLYFCIDINTSKLRKQFGKFYSWTTLLLLCFIEYISQYYTKIRYFIAFFKRDHHSCRHTLGLHQLRSIWCLIKWHYLYNDCNDS